MFKEMSFEEILARCLARVPEGIDKREGSLLYDALAPAAAELAQGFMLLSTLKEDYAFPDTVRGESLTKKAMERSVLRKKATAALRRGEFKDSDGKPIEVPIGGRYSGGALNFTVVEQEEKGLYQLVCETLGTGGNSYFGTLLPIEYVPGLGSARLGEVIIPGQEQESDEQLRKRYFESLQGESFGGNIRDYTNWATGIEGVGGVRVYPVWQGGGSVKLVVIASDGSLPSTQLIEKVQTAIDPEPNQGLGLGLAPIGHTVTVEPVKGAPLEIGVEITLTSGTTWQTIKPKVEAVLEEYFLWLRQNWAAVDAITVRISQIETRILSMEGVLDAGGAKINGKATNLTLPADEIPLLGKVALL